MFYEILDKKRQDILPLFEKLSESFYLAGGTALALQIGHRDSIDFDFFTNEDIDTAKLFENLKEIFTGHELLITQEENNTLAVIIDSEIKVSFMTYKYELLKSLTKELYINLASMEDIACMKLSAINARATQKDYVDIFYLLKHFTLSEILEFAKQKFPNLDTNLILKSLVYFDDVELEPIKFAEGMEVEFEEIKNFIETEVAKHLDFIALP